MVALLSTFIDPFSGPLNTEKWDLVYGVLVDGDKLLIPESGMFIESKLRYGFDSAFVKVESNMGSGGTRYVYFGLTEQRPGVYGSYPPRFEMYLLNNTLYLVSGNFPDGFDNQYHNVPYNATAHTYWRMTKNGGLVIWFGSPDGKTWTELWRVDTGPEYSFATNTYQVLLSSNSGLTYLSNFNVVAALSLIWVKKPDGTWENVTPEVKFPDGDWKTSREISCKFPDGTWKVVAQ